MLWKVVNQHVNSTQKRFIAEESRRSFYNFWYCRIAALYKSMVKKSDSTMPTLRMLFVHMFIFFILIIIFYKPFCTVQHFEKIQCSHSYRYNCLTMIILTRKNIFLFSEIEILFEK